MDEEQYTREVKNWRRGSGLDGGRSRVGGRA
jgi:hypothetical protein